MKTLFARIFTALVAGVLMLAIAQAAQNAEVLTTRDRQEDVSTSVGGLSHAGQSENVRNLRLNFRGVSLETALNYLSDAAGFIVILEREVRGKIDVVSAQPVNKDEAVAVLDKALNQNGYSAIRNGRMLTIVPRDDAKKRDLPVIAGSNPKDIPKTDRMVTQIVPVRHASASQLTRDLQPLLPSYVTMTANDAGNALVLTATQTDIRRMAEIVDAIDSSIATTSSLKVFALRFADAKELATLIKDLFDTQSANRNGNTGFQAQFFDAPSGGPGADAGGVSASQARGAAGTGAGGSRANAGLRVIAVADERSNSLIVSAAEDLMPTIQRIIRNLDVSASEVTEFRVFRLKNADPSEMAVVLTDLFSEEGTSGETRAPGFQFNGGGLGALGARGASQESASNSSNPSGRSQKMGRVIAVPDHRTSSLIVSAADNLMTQIGELIQRLDADGARKQKVFVYALQNADTQNVEEILRTMFESNSSRASNRDSTQNNALSNRAEQQNSGQTSSSGFAGFGQGSSGLGGSVGGAGR